MNYLLDTNICIHFFKGQFGFVQKIRQVGFSECAISEITLAELYYGASKSQNPVKNKLVVSNFLDKISILPIFSSLELYGTEKARLKKQKEPS